MSEREQKINYGNDDYSDDYPLAGLFNLWKNEKMEKDQLVI